MTLYRKMILAVVFVATSIALLAAACTDSNIYTKRHRWSIGRCEWVDPSAVEPLPDSAYQRVCRDTCIGVLPPFDHSGWWESNMNSHRLRGREVLRLGCIGCGKGCNTIMFNFDFTNVQEDAEIMSAKLAVLVTANPENMWNAILKGRVNVGGDYTVISEGPVFNGSWALFDITPFVCRTVLERRNSAGMELSLPCWATDSDCCGDGARPFVATVALSKDQMSEPRIIIEYR